MDTILTATPPGSRWVCRTLTLDLIKTDLIINHNAEQVVALLGKPKASEKSDFSYALGQCSGFGWLNSILVVKFENDLVTQLSVERDAP